MGARRDRILDQSHLNWLDMMYSLRKHMGKEVFNQAGTISHPPCPTLVTLPPGSANDVTWPPCAADNVALPLCSVEDVALPLCPTENIIVGQGLATDVTQSPCFSTDLTTPSVSSDDAPPSYFAEDVIVLPCSVGDVTPNVAPHLALWRALLHPWAPP